NPVGGSTSAPTITFTPVHRDGATLATETPVLGLTVSSVTINATGGSYATGAAPTVTFSLPAPTANEIRATGSVSSSQFVSTIAVTAPGTGYTSAPTVGFIGGGAPTTSATATAVLSPNRPVVSVSITNPGSGYLVAPSVTFSPGVTGG